MALCPACGEALPATLEVREARVERGRAELAGVRRPEPFVDVGTRGAGARGGGRWVLWVVVLVAIAAALAAWRWAPVARIP